MPRTSTGSPSIITVTPSKEFLVVASIDAPVLVTTYGSTLYYKTTPGVSSSDTALTAGQQVYSTVNLYLISSANVLVSIKSSLSEGFIGNSDTHIYKDSASNTLRTDATNFTFDGTTTTTGGQTVVNASTTAGVPKVWTAGYTPPTSTSGTDVTPTANRLYAAEIFVPANMTLTGAKILNGSTAATDKYLPVLYDSAGAIVANGATAGIVGSGTAALQSLVFSGTGSVNPGTLKGPATYFLGVQMSGTGVKFRAHAFGDHRTTAPATVTFGTVAAITAPTTFTADTGPIMCLY